MKLAVITPCLAPDRGYIRLLDESALRFGIDLMPYGVGHQFADWRTMLIGSTIPELRRLSEEGYSHVLVVDGRDTLFLTNIYEIMWKYFDLGAPKCLMSHDDQYPTLSVVKLNAGCYMGETRFIAHMWANLAQGFPNEGDYQQWVQRSWPIEGMRCDTRCNVFQSVDGAMHTAHNRALNLQTGSMPCILHFRGGYSDPVSGREGRMKPVLEQLYA